MKNPFMLTSHGYEFKESVKKFLRGAMFWGLVVLTFTLGWDKSHQERRDYMIVYTACDYPQYIQVKADHIYWGIPSGLTFICPKETQ